MTDDEKDWADSFRSRFVERANVIQQAGMPPLEGAMRLQWLNQRKLDYQDFLMVSDCEVVLSDRVLTLTLDLRPQICDATIRNSPDGIADKGLEQETQTSMQNIANALPADGNKITSGMLDSGSDLQALIKDSERFRTVVKTVEPIDVKACPGFSLTHGYLA